MYPDKQFRRKEDHTRTHTSAEQEDSEEDSEAER